MNKLFLAIGAALAGLGLGIKPGPRTKHTQTSGTWQKTQPSEVAHLSKKERQKRRRIHRLSTRKRR